MAKKTETHKNKDRLLTEAKLLKAAEEVFSKEGFKGATTRLIAEKAQSNISLINRYFEGKYGLLISLIEKKKTESLSEEFIYPAQDSVARELACYGEIYLTNFIHNLNLFKIVTGQFLSDAKFLKEFRNKIPLQVGNEQILGRLNHLVQQGKLIKDYPVQQIINDLETYAIGLTLTHLLVRGDDPKKVMAEFQGFIAIYARSLKTIT